MLMFVNSLDRVNIAYIAVDDSSYGKFMCVYSKGGKLQQYSHHIKCGFKSAAEAIRWYLECYPQGNLLDKQNFLGIEQQLLELKLPNSQASNFDPLHMVTRTMPVPVKKTKDGKILSDFE